MCAWRISPGFGGVLLAVAVGVAQVHSATAAPPRLEYRGVALPRHQVETLLAPALRAPADSITVAATLGVLVARLQDLGYLDARADAAWDSVHTTLGVSVTEGRDYRFGSVTMVAPSSAESTTLVRALAIGVGMPASPRAATQAVERALREATDHGHPYASLGVSGWETHGDSVSVAFSGSLGPAVTITRARVDGLSVTRPSVAEKAMGHLAGLPYNPAAANAARDRLAQLGLFRSVRYEGLQGESDWSHGQLIFRVEEPRYNRFEGALGVQGTGGAVGLARLDLGNLLGTGRSMSLSWESRGRGVVNFGARYTEPLLFGLPLKLELTLDQNLQDTLYARARGGVRAHWSLSGQERLEGGFEQERVVQDKVEVREADLQSTVFAIERDTRDQPLAPRTGTRARVAATQVFKIENLRPEGRRNARASAVELSSEWHQPLHGRAGLALELDLAGRFSTESVLPLYERYAMGGAATLRGYNEEEFRVDRYALSRLEWRWFLGAGGQHAALFWDHALMTTRQPTATSSTRSETQNRDGVGFGLRLEAAGGLIGVDYGLEPGRPPLEGKIHLQLISSF